MCFQMLLDGMAQDQNSTGALGWFLWTGGWEVWMVLLIIVLATLQSCLGRKVSISRVLQQKLRWSQRGTSSSINIFSISFYKTCIRQHGFSQFPAAVPNVSGKLETPLHFPSKMWAHDWLAIYKESWGVQCWRHYTFGILRLFCSSGQSVDLKFSLHCWGKMTIWTSKTFHPHLFAFTPCYTLCCLEVLNKNPFNKLSEDIRVQI